MFSKVLFYSELAELVSNENQRTLSPAVKKALEVETEAVNTYNIDIVTRSPGLTGLSNSDKSQYITYGNFDEQDSQIAPRAPEVIVNIGDEKNAISQRINDWIATKRKPNLRSPFWPIGFNNDGQTTMCQFFACAQLVGAILVNTNVNYKNHKYPTLEMFMHLYVQGNKFPSRGIFI
jgi:hypothetical protein